jgi:hypothetical protein
MDATFLTFTVVMICLTQISPSSNAARINEKPVSSDHEQQLGNIEYPREWHLWKTKHGKKYETPKHELSKHLVWLSNKHYIEQHNKHTDVLGYGLAMNQFGDLVSLRKLMFCN